MAETLWAAGILMLLGFGYLMTRPRKTLAGDMEAPMDLERHRAKSEAKMGAAVSDADDAAAAPLVAFVEKIGTGEQAVVTPGPPVRRHHVYRGPSQRQLEAMRSRLLAPIRQFEADPLSAPIPGRHRVAEPVLFGDAVERFFTPALPAPAFPEPPAEPEPWQLGGFTDTWTAADVARMVAEAKTEATR